MNARGFPLEAKLLLAFAVGAFGLLVALVFAAREGNAYLEADRQGDYLRDLDFAVTSMVLSLRTAESGQRGYLLTGRDNYLVPYHLAIRDVSTRVGNATTLAAHDPPTAAALAALQPRIDRLLSGLAHAIDVRRRDGFDAALPLVSSDASLTEMRAIRETWETVHADLTARAGVNQSGLHAHYQDTMNLLVTGVGIALLLLAIAYAAIAREVGERRRLAERIRREADHDALTELPNRRFFTQWLGYALAQARRENGTLGLLCIDIDGFKAVNDREGHKAGDRLLAQIARRFAAEKRDSDVLARLGGDEFVLGAAGAASGRDLALLAQRLIDALAAAPALTSQPIGASIGIAFFPDDAGDPPGLLASADAAMYAAKRRGRNRMVFSARRDDA